MNTAETLLTPLDRGAKCYFTSNKGGLRRMFIQQKQMKQKILLVLIALLIIHITYNSVGAKSSHSRNSYIEVLFFHGKYRCSIEQTIEALTRNTVEDKFAKELKNGKVKFKVIDYDKKNNQHYINDYKLINQAVILVKYFNDKAVKWKNCKKVWDYVDNESKFSKYIINKIKNFEKE